MHATNPLGSVANRPFHLMAKPAGAACNLACSYCFYLSRWDQGKVQGMSDATLDRFIHDYITAQPGNEITFAWQGGEPTLLGVDYFRKVVELQRWHCPPGKTIANSMQTNGTLLDDAWCEFLARERFLIGLSCDGTPQLHDRRRVDRGGQATATRVIAAAERLRKHHVEFNVLCVVGSHNVDHPQQVYRFLQRLGTNFIQFIPLVESPQQRKFGNDKRDSLPNRCQTCQWRKLCHGGCPKHRFPAAPGALPAPHLCAGWMAFFAHAGPAFQRMSDLLRQQRAPAEVMQDRALLRTLGLSR